VNLYRVVIVLPILTIHCAHYTPYSLYTIHYTHTPYWQVNLYRVVIVLPADGDELLSEAVFDKVQKLFIGGPGLPGLLIDPKSKAYVPGLEVR
jgi:hypothetical protein